VRGGRRIRAHAVRIAADADVVEDLEIVGPLADELEIGAEHGVELLDHLLAADRLHLGALAGDAGHAVADLVETAVDLHVIGQHAALDPAAQRRLVELGSYLLDRQSPLGRRFRLPLLPHVRQHRVAIAGAARADQDPDQRQPRADRQGPWALQPHRGARRPGPGGEHDRRQGGLEGDAFPESGGVHGSSRSESLTSFDVWTMK
jgi:hypothetical protein